MAPVRKSRSVNKRFSNETSPEKDAGNSSKSKQRKKKLSLLGPQWSKGELEHFYDAYRKHGPIWKKVAAAVSTSRSVEMVEALFNMNRAYLSLPEGTATVLGLIAMMTDHYNALDGIDSEGEGHDASGLPQKPQKRKRAKGQLSDSREGDNQPGSIASSDGCLSLLKQAQAYGTQRRATGKRTPRFPVPSSYWKDDRESYSPPNKRVRKPVDSNDDVARYLAALTDASKKGGSPKASKSPYRRAETSKNSPIKGWGKMDRVGSSRERRHEKEASDIDAASSVDREGVGTVEVLRKGKLYYGKNVKIEEAEGNNSDDSGEACSGTGLRRKSQKRKVDGEVSTGKYSPHGLNKSKKLLFGDEFDALQALAELSTSMLPTNLMESESSAQLKEERTELDMDDKSSTPEATSTSHPGEKPKQSEPKENSFHAVSGAGISRQSKFAKHSSNDSKAVPEGNQKPKTTTALRRKRKPKVLDSEAPTDSQQNKSVYSKELAEEDNKSVVKTRRTVQVSAPSKHSKRVKMSEESSFTGNQKRPGIDLVVSTPQVSALSMPQKPPNRRKVNLKRTLLVRGKSPDKTLKAQQNKESLSEQEQLKDKVSSFLSYPLARRWCVFEWFYSLIDYPWFAKMEFVDYINHVGLGHVPRLTRLEWSVIKSSLGRPRRFSERLLQEEREKLKQYRESVRHHYTELRTGAREGLPTDLARPLSVGNRVIAIHPKTREVHDGKILKIDQNKCSVLFDRSELGVDFVADIDCMPSNPLEYMPEALRRQILSADKCSLMSKEALMRGHPNFGGSVMFPFSGLENISLPTNPPVKQGDTNGAILQGKASPTMSSPPQATCNQSYITAYNKAREAEIRAFALNRALDEKELEPEMLEIVKNSRSKAHAMVNAAIKAASSMKEGEDAYKKIRETLDSIDKDQSISGSTVPSVKHEEHANGFLDHHGQSLSNTSEPLVSSSKAQDGSEKNELQIPSELITSCVATWLMIQMCTERQYPPADVAQLIDSALTSLRPRCPRNLPIYREIQTCMGKLKTQILALVPT